MITHTPTTANYTLSLHDALPISDVGDDEREALGGERRERLGHRARAGDVVALLGEQLGGGLAHRRVVVDHESAAQRSEEHTSELQSRGHLVCRLLLEKKKGTVVR